LFEKEAGKFSGGEQESNDTLDGLFLALHENKKDGVGKILWGPYITDVDEAILQAKRRLEKQKSKKAKNFMGR
jgi:hypothetical protein